MLIEQIVELRVVDSALSKNLIIASELLAYLDGKEPNFTHQLAYCQLIAHYSPDKHYLTTDQAGRPTDKHFLALNPWKSYFQLLELYDGRYLQLPVSRQQIGCKRLIQLDWQGSGEKNLFKLVSPYLGNSREALIETDRVDKLTKLTVKQAELLLARVEKIATYRDYWLVVRPYFQEVIDRELLFLKLDKNVQYFNYLRRIGATLLPREAFRVFKLPFKVLRYLVGGELNYNLVTWWAIYQQFDRKQDFGLYYADQYYNPLDFFVYDGQRYLRSELSKVWSHLTLLAKAKATLYLKEMADLPPVRPWAEQWALAKKGFLVEIPDLED